MRGTSWAAARMGRASGDGHGRHHDGKIARSGSAGRWLPIRHKLLGAMALPLVTLSLVLGFEVWEVERKTNELERQTELATGANGPSGLLTRLQDERNWAAVDSIGGGDQIELTVEGYGPTRRRTDDAIADFRRLLRRSEPETRQAFEPAVDGLTTGLDGLRQLIDDDPAEHTIENVDFGNTIFDSYGELIQPFFTGTTQVALAIHRGDLRQGARLVETSARQIEAIANLGRAVTIISLLQGGIDERSEISDVTALLAQVQRYAERLRSDTNGLYQDTGDDELFVGFTQALSDELAAALRGEFHFEEFLDLIALPPEDSYNGYQNRVAATIEARADELRDGATHRERLYVGLIALTIGLAVAIMLVVSLSITRPLETLTQQAVGMANHSLPQAVSSVLRTPMGEDVTMPEMATITVASGDEVGDVAEVLSQVQDSAIELAVGQALLRRNLADSFVSLGRRNQNLLSRQLDFITELEQGETDADALAQLFQLDHLATRMRRNAENLLVLAGNESPRRWTAPVRITDIIRAAVSEVEDYPRVVLRTVETVTVVGSAAADLAHLLAELIEDALLYSPPDERVEIRGLTQAAGYTLAIIDAGLGMSRDEIAQANRRLAGSESFTVSPSKYLGHYVAGNLAFRHNIHVRLQHSAGAGITATVHLPASLLTSESPTRLEGSTA